MACSPRNKRIPRISCAQEVFGSWNADSGFYMAAIPRNEAFPGIAATGRLQHSTSQATSLPHLVLPTTKIENIDPKFKYVQFRYYSSTERAKLGICTRLA